MRKVVIAMIPSRMKMNVRNLDHFPWPPGYHLPLPSFSDSLQSFWPVLKLLNLGKVDEIFRFDLEKKPSFRVEKLGYCLT